MSATLRVYVTKGRAVPVASLEAASEAVRTHIWRDGDPIPSSRWSGAMAGMVVDANGRAVARVSYNGRVWDPSEWTREHKPALLWDPCEGIS